jgi:hypothetical protein
MARLKRGAAATAQQLLLQGPPLELGASRLERHMVFLSEEELVLVFEGERADEEASRFLQSSDAVEGTDRLGELLEDPPALLREVFSWERPSAPEGVSFGPDPGPGDSDGGERD